MSDAQELQTIRTGLEEESRSLNEERQKLEMEVQALREKVAIEELRRNNQVTRDAIAQLRSEVSDLVQRLNSFAQGPLPQETVAVVIAPPTEVPVVQQQAGDRKPEERRRRFF
jgi:predicted nuclease with TOPRIM domain